MEEQKTEQSPVVSTVTRPKHPGRVAQGKKLAAMMKERKEALLKNKDNNKDSEVSNSTGTVVASGLSRAAGDHVRSTMANFGMYGAFILIFAGGIYYLYNRKKSPVETPPEPLKKQPKIYME